MRHLSLFFATVVTMLILSCSKSKNSGSTTPTTVNELAGPIQKPVSGYGADGSYKVAVISFSSPAYAGKNVDIFYPAGITSPVPVIFYCHPFGGEDSIGNMGLYQFIAKKGYAVVFSPYPTLNATVDERYNCLWQGFKKAVTDYSNIIDTKKAGFVGYSFGGGASISLAWRGFVTEGWGANGRFIFTHAPYYAYQLTDSMLQTFPANTKLLSEIYADDIINDHRMAIDIFKNINIPVAEKDFLLVKPATIAGYNYVADHSLPNSKTAFDAYDYYAIYRLLDGLIDYSFNGSANGKNTALGNGSAAQVTMPSYNGETLPALVETDSPTPLYLQSKYLYPCGNSNNPRVSHCN